jgi:hypothetical protein
MRAGLAGGGAQNNDGTRIPQEDECMTCGSAAAA